jgi:hypothetical protein
LPGNPISEPSLVPSRRYQLDHTRIIIDHERYAALGPELVEVFELHDAGEPRVVRALHQKRTVW